MQNPERKMMLRLPLKCRETVLAALRQAGFEGEAAHVEMFTSAYLDENNDERERWIGLASAVAAYPARIQSVQVDEDATISDSEGGGQYVLAWIWVDDPEFDPDEGEDVELDE